MKNRYYQSFRLPFINRVFWRRISEEKFFERVAPFAAPNTQVADLILIMGLSRGSVVLTNDSGQSFKCIIFKKAQSNELTVPF